jgi:starch phosphorylase
VQAERMVREYVTALYVPAAAASRDLADPALAGSALAGTGEYQGFGPARELAAWKRRVIQAWPQVRVEHVESEAAGQALGSALTVRVSVALGELTPDDVAVEVVYGRPDDADEIIVPAYEVLARGDDPPQISTAGGEPSPPDPPAGGNRGGGVLVRYSGEVPLDQPGPFGYTVRVLPNHPLLDSRAELGLVTYPQAPAGMTNGDLR